LPRLPELRFDKRMQLIRLNTGPAGRRGNGLFVVLLEEVGEQATVATEGSDQHSVVADIAPSHRQMADVSH